MGDNILATGLAVTSLMGNSKIGQKLQKVMAVIYALQLVMKLLTKLEIFTMKGLISALALNSATSALPFKDGGIVADKVSAYSRGGIAKGPKSGYPAVLHGNEANYHTGPVSQ